MANIFTHNQAPSPDKISKTLQWKKDWLELGLSRCVVAIPSHCSCSTSQTETGEVMPLIIHAMLGQWRAEER